MPTNRRQQELEDYASQLERDALELARATAEALLESRTIHAHVDQRLLVDPARWKSLARQQKMVASVFAQLDAATGRHTMLRICDMTSDREIATYRLCEGVVVPTRN